MAWWTWGTWPDAFVDFGREMYNAWRISQGDVLYKDLAYFNGPLSPHFNGLVFSIFGPSLRTIFIANLTLLALFLILLRNMLVKLSDRFTAWVGIIVTLTIFSFGQYVANGNYNFIAPYSHEATHGLMLGLAALMCLWKWQETSLSKWLIFAGLFAGGAFMTKPETALATLVSGLIVIAGAYITQKNYSKITQTTGLFIGVSILPIIAASILLTPAMPFNNTVINILSPWQIHYIKDIGSFTAAGITGTDNPLGNIKTILAYSFWWIIIFIPAGLLALLEPKYSPDKKVTSFIKKYSPLIIGILYLIILLIIRSKIPWFYWFYAPKPLPLFTLAVLTWSIINIFRNIDSQRALKIASFSVFALIMLAKIIFKTRLYHYGFVLALPATLLLISALVGWMPSFLNKRNLNGNIFRAASLALLAVVCFIYMEKTNDLISYKPGTIVSGPNAYLTDIRGKFMAMAYNEITLNTDPNSTLAVLPEGAMLNFLTYRRNPTPYSNFMPPLLKIWGEDKIILSFEKNPPDYIALFHKDMTDIGYPFFGSDYGVDLMSWIRKHYASIAIYGDKPLVPGSRFGIELLKINTKNQPTKNGK